MDLHGNDSETAESIKEAKAICTCAIWEAKTFCSAAIREAETQGASQAESLHRQHAKVIKHLEEQVIQKEGKSQIDFLSACQTALNDSAGEPTGALVASYHILMGQTPYLTHSPYHKRPPLPSTHLLQQLLLHWCLSTPPGPKGDYPPRPCGWHASWWYNIKGNCRGTT